MTGFAVTIWQAIACIGFGAAVLKLVRVTDRLTRQEYASWSFAIGFGVLGWALFFLGVFSGIGPASLSILMVVGSPGVYFIWRHAHVTATSPEPANAITWILVMAFVALAVLDGIEGLAPPSDADSLAYHFDIPKHFAERGVVEFIPRAMDGAIPLMTHMTYLAAYALGGEEALTIWVSMSAWGALALFYQFIRPHLSRNWSLAIVLAFASVPAFIYSSGSGHIESRSAMFVLLAVICLARFTENQQRSFLIVAAMACGFFAGSKYSGLVYMTAIFVSFGAVALKRCETKEIVLLAGLFCFVALLAGGQWYFWNWLNSGDPFFPTLFAVLGMPDSAIWDMNHHIALSKYLATEEKEIPRTLMGLISYPFLATFAGLRILESGRVGFGPLLVLLLPLTIAGLWKFRDKIGSSSLLPVGWFLLSLYILWFFLGPSQRVRHFLPLYPVALALFSIAAVHWASRPFAKRLLVSVFVAVLGIQSGALGLFSINAVAYQLSSESKDAYLDRTLSGYGAIKWANQNLSPSSKLYTEFRNLNYYLQIPFYYGHFVQEAKIDVRPGVSNPSKLYNRLAREGITHLLVSEVSTDQTTGSQQWRSLVQMGCAKKVVELEARGFLSRTLSTVSEVSQIIAVYELQTKSCKL